VNRGVAKKGACAFIADAPLLPTVALILLPFERADDSALGTGVEREIVLGCGGFETASGLAQKLRWVTLPKKREAT